MSKKKPPQQTPNISRNQTHRQDVLPRKDNGKRDQKKLESFSASLSEEDIDKCVDKLVKADYISVVGGLMTASPIGQVYSHVLMQLFPDVTNISNLDVYAYSALNRLTDKSVAIIISFPRFSMVLDDLAKSMKKKKVFQLGITNSGDSPPVAKYADILVKTPIELSAVQMSMTTPLSFLNILIARLLDKYPDKFADKLQNYDKYFTEFYNLMHKF